jgi:hypothetical protein
MERLRRRRVAALATAAVAATALAVAGCGGGGSSDQTGSTAGDVASFVPAGSPLYLELTTDLDGPQWTQVKALAKLFPGYPEFQKMLDDELSSENVDFDTEVKPLLGDRAAVAALSIPDAAKVQGTLTSGDATGAAEAADDTPFVAVVDIADGKDADVTALLVKGGATQAGQHAGVPVYKDSSGDTVAAVDDGALVVSDKEQQLFAALDAHAQGGDKTLAGTQKFTDALSKLPPDVFGQAYIDLGTLIQRAGSSSPQLEQLGLGDYRNAVVAASLAAEQDGARLKGVVLGAPDLGLKDFTPTLDAHAPADAVAYIGFNDLAGTTAKILDTVRSSAGAETKQQIDALTTQLPALLGVSVDDLAALTSGEHAVVVTSGTPTPGAALALKVEDGARAQATLDTLRTKVPQLVATFSPDTQLPDWRRVDLAGGVQGWELPLSKEAGAVYGVDGDLAIIGTSVPAVTAVQRPTSPLSDSADYQAGTSGMPDEVTSVFWINLTEGVSTLKALGALDDADPQVLANLKPLKSIAAWTTAGDMPTFEVFLRIK